MGKNVVVSLLVLGLLMCYGVMAMAWSLDYEEEDWGRDPREEDWEAGHRGGHRNWFILQRSRLLLKTEAGEMRIVKSVGRRMTHRHINVGFLSMEPNSLFVPQYLDSSLILFVQTGQAQVGLVHSHELGERKLKAGDIYRIPAGSTFYLQNTGHSQRLQLILSIDSSDSLRMGTLENFFIGGGTYPKSVLSGFSSDVLTSAFNVSSSELKQILTKQQNGPIVYVNHDSHSSPNPWAKFAHMKEQDRLEELKKMVDLPQKQTPKWWRKLFNSMIGAIDENDKKNHHHHQHHHHHHNSYNLYESKPDFKNNYGSSLSVDENNYSPLKHSGISVYLVNLTAGSMLAPHVNPSATEYGVVLRGSGSIQVVFPNGTLAMKAQLKPGRVFWVPRYFPFVQVASNNEALEFFGFTTSAQPNSPQFMAGSSSVLEAMKGSQLAAAFGVSQESLSHFVNAQSEAVILPYSSNSGRNRKTNYDKTITTLTAADS